MCHVIAHPTCLKNDDVVPRVGVVLVGNVRGTRGDHLESACIAAVFPLAEQASDRVHAAHR